MKLVLDASVLVKWLIADPEREADTEKATELILAIGDQRHEVIMPPHWLAEVSAVLCRLSPETAEADTETLVLLDWRMADNAAVYRRAANLSMQLSHHLFDTLYHSVALESDATLVTADRNYCHKSLDFGHIVLLDEFGL